MTRSRSRILGFVAWSGLVLVALRPLGAVQSAVDRLVAPLRFVAELASPLKLVRRSEVRAAEARLASEAEREGWRNLRLVEDLARDAEPSEPALREARRLVHGEVIGRVSGNRDRLRVRVHDARGVDVGMPVAVGDAYAGRVVRVIRLDRPEAPDDGAEHEAVLHVELVTARDFHVGASVVRDDARDGGEDVLMTVGGVELGRARRWTPDQEVRLAVHAPSDRGLRDGVARVHELFAEAEPYAELADGLRLGRVRVLEDELRWAIDPELDYLDGLFRVVVLAPPDAALPSGELAEHALVDDNWIRVAPLAVADPSPWREAVKLRSGASSGVEPGAAVVAIGARLVGRVTRVYRWSSDVSFLGDPGFSVVAVARFDDDPTPRILGRLVSLGRDPDDRSVRFRWVARVDLDLAGSGPQHALLYTGSGDGLASGFFLGSALVPVDVAPGDAPIITLAGDVDPRRIESLFVRVDPEARP